MILVKMKDLICDYFALVQFYFLLSKLFKSDEDESYDQPDEDEDS